MKATPTDIESQIRHNVNALVLQLWPGDPHNLQKLPSTTDRVQWFEAFVAEKRSEWQSQYDKYLQYGLAEKAAVEKIKLHQLQQTLKQLGT